MLLVRFCRPLANEGRAQDLGRTRGVGRTARENDANRACIFYHAASGDCIIKGMLADLALGDVVRMRKPHPCGSSEWMVVRLGADIGLTCRGCGHRILLPRRDLAKRMKRSATREAHDATET